MQHRSHYSIFTRWLGILLSALVLLRFCALASHQPGNLFVGKRLQHAARLNPDQLTIDILKATGRAVAAVPTFGMSEGAIRLYEGDYKGAQEAFAIAAGTLGLLGVAGELGFLDDLNLVNVRERAVLPNVSRAAEAKAVAEVNEVRAAARADSAATAVARAEAGTGAGLKPTAVTRPEPCLPTATRAQLQLPAPRQPVALLPENAQSLAARGATQLEFEFAKDFGKTSGLVIGRGRDLAKPGALGQGEYKLGWFSVQNTLGMEAEWAVNQAQLRNVMRLNLPIRDASPLWDVGGFYLNRERNLLQSSGWTYQNGYWIPPKP